MDVLLFIATAFFGLLLRVAVPLAITALLVWVLRRVDAHWQMESLQELSLAQAPLPQGKQLACWELMSCPPHRREHCQAYQTPEQPCWEVFRVNGNLQEACARCLVWHWSGPLEIAGE